MDTKVCSVCGREKKLIGKGMCCACYHRERRKAIGAGETKREGGFTVSVDFAPMAFLLEELKKRAGAELRDVGPQILWELNKSLGAGACAA
ncbi:MAG: hypothetical protein AAGU11_13615 [Syntrophobacteraceae bacterium]